MTEGDRVALEALNSRFTHTAAIAQLVAEHASSLPPHLYDALRGVAETLTELVARMDAIVEQPGTAG